MWGSPRAPEVLVMISNLLRRRVHELEVRDDYRAIHELLKGWPWPPSERLDTAAAFAEVTRRIAAREPERGCPNTLEH
jgi:hypothetical protein